MSTKHAADDEKHPRADKRAKSEAETKKALLCPHCELEDARPEEVCTVCQRAICSFFCGLTPKTICNVPKCRVRLACHELHPVVGTLVDPDAERCGDCEAMYCALHKGGGRVCHCCGTWLCASFLEVHHDHGGEAYCLACSDCRPYDAERAYEPVAPAEPVDPHAPDAGADEDGGELDVPEPTLESTKKGRWVPASASVAALRRSVAAMEFAVQAELNAH